MGLVFWIVVIVIGVASIYHELSTDEPITRRINPATGNFYARYRRVPVDTILSLLEANLYYQKLTPEGKQRFLERTQKIIYEKTFIGMQKLEITDEMRVRVSACIAQITFGLKDYSLSYFHTVRLYPDIFYSKLMGKNLKGGTLTSGYLLLSWKNFVEGFADPDDKYNLGLHETAHALRISVQYGNNFDKHFSGYLDTWENATRAEFEAMRGGRASFLRAYGGTNVEEFFAVSVEHFFEVPAAFRERLPELYRQLSILLNQDPLETIRDYRLPMLLETELTERPLVPSSRYRSWHWSLTVLLVGIFVGVPASFVLATFFVVPTGVYWMLYLLLTIATLILSRKLVDPSRQMLGPLQFILFGVLGAGPVLFSLVLLLNMAVPVQFDEIEEYRIVRTTPDDLRVHLQDNVYEEDPEIRWLTGTSIHQAEEGKIFRMHFRRGLFFLKQFEHAEVVDKK